MPGPTSKAFPRVCQELHTHCATRASGKHRKDQEPCSGCKDRGSSAHPTDPVALTASGAPHAPAAADAWATTEETPHQWPRGQGECPRFSPSRRACFSGMLLQWHAPTEGRESLPCPGKDGSLPRVPLCFQATWAALAARPQLFSLLGPTSLLLVVLVLVTN